MYLCTRIKNTGNKSPIDKGISSVLTSKDPLAQLVEHNTFNVGVLGSSPKRITRIPAESQGTKETSKRIMQAHSSLFRLFTGSCKRATHILRQLFRGRT